MPKLKRRVVSSGGLTETADLIAQLKREFDAKIALVRQKAADQVAAEWAEVRQQVAKLNTVSQQSGLPRYILVRQSAGGTESGPLRRGRKPLASRVRLAEAAVEFLRQCGKKGATASDIAAATGGRLGPSLKASLMRAYPDLPIKTVGERRAMRYFLVE